MRFAHARPLASFGWADFRRVDCAYLLDITSLHPLLLARAIRARRRLALLALALHLGLQRVHEASLATKQGFRFAYFLLSVQSYCTRYQLTSDMK